VRLSKLFGRERLLASQVALPNDDYFPDVFDASKEAVDAMAHRIAVYMGVSPDSFRLEIFSEDEEAWRATVPLWSGAWDGAAGLFFHGAQEGRFTIGVHAKKLKDPIALAAVIAHEFAHVLLLGGELMNRDELDMEPLTDLATVFLGMGVFSASAAFQFKQWNEGEKYGWSWSRTGYLPEPVWGYALARFAKERNETQPAWAAYLPTNILSDFRKSRKWLDTQNN